MLLSSDNSSTSSDNVSLDKAKLRDIRRLSRLYGSNIRHVAKSEKRSKRKIEKGGGRESAQARTPPMASNTAPNASTRQSQTDGKGETAEFSFDRLAQPKSTVRKFLERPDEERQPTEMHASNFNIDRPWFVGYRNSPTLPAGSPLAISSRYGYGGAIQLTKQCSVRVRTTDLEHAVCDQGSKYRRDMESDLVPINEWVPPLNASPHGVTCGRLGGGGHFASTPKLWPATSTMPSSGSSEVLLARSKSESSVWFETQTTLGVTTSEADRRPTTAPGKEYLPSHLLRALEREREVWERVAEGAKSERKAVRQRRRRPGTVPRASVRFPPNAKPPFRRSEQTGANKVYILN